MKIALLCNNKMALPAVQMMAKEGVLAGIATADTDTEVVSMYGAVVQQLHLPHTRIARKGYKEQLREWLEGVGADVVFVMTFPYRIPADILQLPRFGFLNFHYGQLPEMRGADPIFESIRQRLPTAGLTVHVMDEGFDTGPVVMREEMQLPAAYTYGMLCSQMGRLGEKMCGQLLNELKTGNMPAAIPQDAGKAAYWPKIAREAIHIDWGKMSQPEIIALVRACNPIARGVPVMLNGWQFGVCDACEIELQGDASNIAGGTIVAMDMQNGLVVCCKDGKGVRLDVIITGEGIFPGYKLALWGINAGMIFGQVQLS